MIYLSKQARKRTHFFFYKKVLSTLIKGILQLKSCMYDSQRFLNFKPLNLPFMPYLGAHINGFI